MEHRLQLIPSESARQSVVHCRHYGIVQHVTVEVNPESVELGPCDSCQRSANASLDSLRTHCIQIKDLYWSVLDALTSIVRGFLSISAAEQHDVLVQHQGTDSVQISDDVGPSTCHQGQIHRSSLTVFLSLRLVEVGMPVEE